MRFITYLPDVCLVLIVSSLTSQASQFHVISQRKTPLLTTDSAPLTLTSKNAGSQLTTEDAFLQLGSSVSGETCLILGDDLKLTCRLNEQHLQNFTASNISFRHQIKETGELRCLSSPSVRAVNTTTAILTVPDVKLEDAGIFTCYVGDYLCPGDQGQAEFVGVAKEVTVEYPPQNVTNFQCIIHNWEFAMTCTWSHPIDYVDMSHINVTSSYSTESHDDYKPCPSPSPTSCHWDEDSIIVVTSVYLVQVNVTNPCANTTASKTFSVLPENFIKPDPVEGLTAVNSPTKPGCLTLSWNQSNRRQNKAYRIKQQVGIEDYQLKTLEDNYTSMSISLCGYPPYTPCNFSVECFPVNPSSVYCSDPVYIDVWTAMTAPDLGPQTTNGSYTGTKCVDGRRSVTLMWQDVEESARNGLIAGYLVRQAKTNLRNTTDPYSTSVEVYCNQSSVLTIFAYNEGGNSRNPSVLVISPDYFIVPSKVTESFTAEIVTNFSSNNNLQLNVSWVVDEETENMDYTIFWCERQAQTCKSKINWEKVPRTQTNCDIQILGSDAGNYLYGISVTDFQTGMGSEIFWTECLFSRNPDTVPAVQNLKVTSMIESVFISWDSSLCFSQSYVKLTNFKIKWGLTAKYDGNNVSGIDGISEMMLPATKSSQMIDSLMANMNYTFTVQPFSFNVQGGVISLRNAIPLGADLPTGTSVSIGKVIGGLASGVFVLIVIFLVHRKCIAGKKKIQISTDEWILDMSNINQESQVATSASEHPTQGNEVDVTDNPHRTVSNQRLCALSMEENLMAEKIEIDFPATCSIDVDIADGSSALTQTSEDSSETVPLENMALGYVQQSVFASHSDSTCQNELPQANMEIQTNKTNNELCKEGQTFTNTSDKSEDNLKSSLPSNCYSRLAENNDIAEVQYSPQLEDYNQSECDASSTDPEYVQSFINCTNCLPNQVADLNPDQANPFIAGLSSQSTNSTLLSSSLNFIVHYVKMRTGQDNETNTDTKLNIITAGLKENNKITEDSNSNVIYVDCTVLQRSPSRIGHFLETTETIIRSPDESSQMSNISSQQSNMDNVSCSTHCISEHVSHISENVGFTSGTSSSLNGGSNADSSPNVDYIPLPV